MPLAKQQDANTSIQIRTTLYAFELPQTLTQQSYLGAPRCRDKIHCIHFNQE